MNYSDFINRISLATSIDQTNADFLAILPQAIDYAEQRLYRELDLMATSTRDQSFSLTSGNRNLVLPTGTFVSISNVNVIAPVGTMGDGGARVPLTNVSWDFLDAVYGTPGSLAVPAYWALQDAANLAVGPWPDQGYNVEIIGAKRPTPLSQANQSTILSLYLPDLLFTAAMIFMSGYQRNYGAQADDPQQGVTWEAQYKTLIASAATEELRKKAAAS